MIKKLASLLLLFSFTAQAGLPPTTIKGQSDASPVTTFNLQVPGSGITRLGGPNALIETGYKNYIQDPGAENPNGPTVWATYSNTAQATPVTGTGGSPTVTWTRTTSSPLRGTGSFLFTKTAVNSQGQGASYDFTIDSADQAKVLNVSFDYAVASGTYLDSDLTVYIYDKTNSQIIQPAGFKILSAATGLPVKQVSTTFQTASNSTSYRLIFHCASTSSSSYVLKFDSISVSPQIITQGTPVTDLAAYTQAINGSTSNPTKGTVARDEARWFRMGGTLIETYNYRQTAAGTAGSGTYLFPIATGSIDTAKLSLANGVGSGALAVVGHGQVNAGGALSDVKVIAYDANNLALVLVATGSYAGSANLGLNNAVVEISFTTDPIPVVGWSSQVQMSSDASTAPMEAKVYLSGNVTSSGAAWTVPFDRVSYDTAGAFNTTSHGFVVPKPGFWEVKLTSNLAGGNTGSYEVYKNGSPISDGPTNNVLFYQGTANNVMSGSLKVKCSANDVLTVVATGTGANIIATGTFATFSQSLGPSQIAASEKINATYNGTPTGTLTNAWNLLTYPTKQSDTHGAYSSGTFTAPRAGFADVFAAVDLGASWAAGNELRLAVFKNGTLYTYGYSVWSGSSGTTSMNTPVSAKGIPVVTGDTLDIRIWTDAAGGNAIQPTTANYLNIQMN